MKKRSLFSLGTSLLLSLALNTSVFASTIGTDGVNQPNSITPNYVPNPGGDVTSSFSSTMRSNALYIAYYASEDTTYPFGTGLEFASKVKSGGAWDYKRSYGATSQYTFAGSYLKGEDLGNMHYGYVGRAAGFSATELKTAAGAYQIYSGTSQGNWYGSYFDDPNDQANITKGINYWNNANLPSTVQTLSLISAVEAGEPVKFMTPPDTGFTSKDFDQLTAQQKQEIKDEIAKNSKIVLKELKESKK